MAVAPDDVPSADECPARDFLQPAEPEDGCLRSGSYLDARLVVRIQHGKIVRGLVLENTSLCCGVIFKRMVPVKMIGGDVQHHCNARVKALDGLQLKAADLQHHPSVFGGTLDESNCRRSDVSADQRMTTTSCNNLASQRSGRGLPIGASDGDDPAFQEARRQFH